MEVVRAQISTRSGDPGAQDVQPVLHGDWLLPRLGPSREFMEQLRDVMEASRGVALDGKVTEVSVLFYPESATPGRN